MTQSEIEAQKVRDSLSSTLGDGDECDDQYAAKVVVTGFLAALGVVLMLEGLLVLFR